MHSDKSSEGGLLAPLSLTQMVPLRHTAAQMAASSGHMRMNTHTHTHTHDPIPHSHYFQPPSFQHFLSLTLIPEPLISRPWLPALSLALRAQIKSVTSL